MLNFSNFKPVEKGNTREGQRVAKGQTFNFKFKKFISKKGGKVNEETQFTLSDVLFSQFGLETKGLIELVAPSGESYLAVVDSDNAVFLRNRKNLKEGNVKGKKFKSTIFEKALSEAGVIDLNLVGVTQKLDLKLVEGSENAKVGEGDSAIQTYGIYEITKAADAELTDEEKAEDAKENESEEEATTASVNSSTAPALNSYSETEEVDNPTPNSTSTAPTPASEDDF